jgi:hypothetical protein
VVVYAHLQWDVRDLSSDRVRAMEEENVYRVWLVLPGENALHGFFLYRGTELPEPNHVIDVEREDDLTDRRRAHVTRVEQNGDVLIHAVELES